MEKERIAGFGCLTLFGLPFLASGLFVGWSGVHLLITGEPLRGGDRVHPVLPLSAGLLFTTVGGGLVFGPFVWRAHVRRTLEEKARGRIRPVYAQPLYVPLIFGVVWNMLTWSAVITFIVSDHDRTTPWFVYAGLGVFAVVGVGLAVWLAREARLRWAFGRFRLRLPPVPLPAGSDVSWELAGPAERLREPQFELAFREETLVEKGENNYRWEGTDLKILALRADIAAEGWRGRMAIPPAPKTCLEAPDLRRRWVLRVQDGRRVASFPLPG